MDEELFDDDEYGDHAEFEGGEDYDEELGEGEDGEEGEEGEEEEEEGEFFYEDQLDVDGVEVDGEEWAQPLAAAVKRRSMGGMEGAEGASLLTSAGVGVWDEEDRGAPGVLGVLCELNGRWGGGEVVVCFGCYLLLMTCGSIWVGVSACLWLLLLLLLSLLLSRWWWS